MLQSIKKLGRKLHQIVWYHYHGMYQGYKPMTKDNQQFNHIYSKLRAEEEILEEQVTQYATGHPDAKLADMDATFKRIKSLLKESRELAIELNEKRKDDEEG